MQTHSSTDRPIGTIGPEDSVAVYARQSDPNKKAESGHEHTTSITAQIDESVKVADRFGVKQWEVYSEQITSEVFEDRPELGRLIANAHKYKAIIVYKYDRIARDPNQLTAFVRIMRSKGLRVISATENEPPPDPIGDMLHYVYGTFAQIEKNNIIQRTKQTKQTLISQGKIIGQGKPLFGYRYDVASRTRTVNEAEAAVVRRIFGMVCSGMSLRQIANTLDTEGVPAPLKSWKPETYPNAKWVPNTLSEIVRAPDYYGEPFRTGKTRTTEKRRKNGTRLDVRTPRDQHQPVGGPTPVIVGRDQWDKAQAYLNDRKKRPRSVLKVWLRGHVFCKYCGASMSPSAEKGGGHVLRCNRNSHCKEWNIKPCGNTSHKLDDLSDFVWARIVRFCRDSDYAEKKINEALNRLQRPDYEAQHATSTAKVATLKSKLAKQLDRWAGTEDTIMAEALQANVSVLRQQIEAEQGVLSELESILARSRSQSAVLNEVKGIIKDWRAVVENADFETRCRIMDALDVLVLCSVDRKGGKAVKYWQVEIFGGPIEALFEGRKPVAGSSVRRRLSR